MSEREAVRLDTRRLVVREIRRDDLDALARYDTRNRARFARFAAERTVDDAARARQLEERLAMRARGTALQCIAFERAAGPERAIVALATLDAITGPPEPSATISYSVDGACEGRGVASETVRALARYAFETMGLARLDATLHPENARSRGLLERLGFELIAELREVPEEFAGFMYPHAAYAVSAAAFLRGSLREEVPRADVVPDAVRRDGDTPG